MDRLLIKHRLLDKGMTLAELSRVTDIPYDRLVKIIGWYRTARDEELDVIASVLDVSVDLLTPAEQRPNGGMSPGSRTRN